MKRAQRLSIAARALYLALLAPCAAFAQDGSPTRIQWTAGPELGVVGEGRRGGFWDGTAFYLGARGDVMFGRSRASSWGWGPGLNVGTNGFDNLHLGGMFNLLLPIHDTYPIVLSAGGYARLAESHWTPGVSGTVFWGSRDFNFSGNYILCGGLFAEYKQGVGSPKENSLVFGFHLDGEFAAVPILFLINLFR